MALRRSRQLWALLASWFTVSSTSTFRFRPMPRFSTCCVPLRRWNLVLGSHAAGIPIGQKLKPPISGLGRGTGQMHLVRCGVLFNSLEKRLCNLVAVNFALQVVFISGTADE